MIISTLGTKICDDAIGFSRGKVRNKNRIVELSPFSFSVDNSALYANMDISFNGSSEYLNQLAESDCKKSVFEEIAKNNCDFLIVDMLCARLYIREFTFEDGMKYRLTESDNTKDNIKEIRTKVEACTKKKIIAERIINPLIWSDNELEYEIKLYAEKLRENFDITKIVLLETDLVNQYITKSNKIDILPNQSLIYQYNLFFAKCVKLFRQFLECKIIRVPKKVIGDEHIKVANMFNFSKNFYEYISECILILSDVDYTEKSEILANQYIKKTETEIEEALLGDLVNLCKIRMGQRKIVLIGESMVFEYLLSKRYGISIHCKVAYKEDGDLRELNAKLQEIQYMDNEYLLVVPHLFPNMKILELLWKYGYGQGSGYLVAPHAPMKLENFVGEYRDYYNNFISSKMPITVTVVGGASSVICEAGIKNDNIRYQILNETTCVIQEGCQTEKEGFYALLYDGAKLEIKKNVKIGRDVHFRCTFFNKSIIGNNSVIEDSVVIFNGDGHAIFDLKTGKNINYDLNNSSHSKHEIVVEDNVHIGEGTFVLSGAKIRKGSYVRPASFINRVFAETGMLEGQPARAITRGD